MNHDYENLIRFLLNAIDGIILVTNPSNLKKFELDLIEKILKN